MRREFVAIASPVGEHEQMPAKASNFITAPTSACGCLLQSRT